MSHRHLVTLLGVVLVVLGATNGGWFCLALWPGCDFLIVGFAYAKGAHRVFGKRPDGTLPLWSWLLFFPLLIYTSAVWHAVRLFQREDASNTVNERLVVGRRLLGREFEGGFDNVIDLTAEFAEPLAIRNWPGYRSFPILDGAAPPPEELRAAVKSLAPGRSYIHCAQGHGRTGLFTLALLLNSGAAGTVEEAWGVVSAARPGVRLSRAQRECIDAYARTLMLEKTV